MDKIRHLKKSGQGRTRGTKNLLREEVRVALMASHGLIASAAHSLGVCRQSIYNAFKPWPELREIVEEERELLLDNAENALHKAIMRGEAWAICFFLKTRGKARGYSEREVSKLDGNVVQTEEAFDWSLLSVEELELVQQLFKKARGTGQQVVTEHTC